MKQIAIIGAGATGLAAAYDLTRKGAETLPIMQAIARWSLRNIADRWQPAEAFMDATPDDIRTAG